MRSAYRQSTTTEEKCCVNIGWSRVRVKDIFRVKVKARNVVEIVLGLGSKISVRFRIGLRICCG